MNSFHELSWPTKALSAGAMLAMVLSLTACPSPDATNNKAGSETPPVTDDGFLATAVSSDRVFFDTDSAELRPDAQATLGERRATAVANYLAAVGVDLSRMQTVSYGKERPAAGGSDESAWAQNRRAVFVQVN